MNATTKAYLAQRYDEQVAASNAADALKWALKMFVFVPEFQTFNTNMVTSALRPKPPVIPSQGRPYKAIVIFFEAGGCDSFNRIVPHSDCKNSKDYYAEYATVRQGAAVPKTELLEIDVPAGSQPCNKFGVHQVMILHYF
jgi:hypothetical protein